MYLQSLWLLNQRVNEFSLYRACPMSPRAGAQIPDMRSNRGNSILARDLVVCLVGEDAGSPTFFARCNLIGGIAFFTPILSSPAARMGGTTNRPRVHDTSVSSYLGTCGNRPTRFRPSPSSFSPDSMQCSLSPEHQAPNEYFIVVRTITNIFLERARPGERPGDK